MTLGGNHALNHDNHGSITAGCTAITQHTKSAGQTITHSITAIHDSIHIRSTPLGVAVIVVPAPKRNGGPAAWEPTR